MERKYIAERNNSQRDEWYQTLYDQKKPRTALLTEFNGVIYENILDESGLGSGFGMKINPKFLKKSNKET